jgi:hypothetical protein
MVFSATILGLAISDRDIYCAEIAPGSRPTVQKMSRFALPAEGWGATQPAALGQQLRSHLREHGIRASRAVVGVPAKWLVAQEKDVPPLDEQAGYAMLRLQAERLSLAENAEMVFDVAGEWQPDKPAHVLLVGMLRAQAERLARVCSAAELSVVSVTSTSLALARLAPAGERAPTIILSRQSAELVWQTADGPRLLRHLFTPEPSGDFPVALLSSELRRATALAPMGTAADWQLWDGIGLQQREVRELNERLKVPLQRGQTLQSAHVELSPGALNGSTDPANAETFLPAVSLALAAAHRRELPDFLHSRLVAPPKARVAPRTLLIAAAVALAVLLLGGLYLDVQSREAEAARLAAEIERDAPEVSAAEARLERFSYGRGFFETRPPMLDCLRELSLSIRPNDPMWVTSFTMRESGRGQVQGRATEQRAVGTLLERLQRHEKFSNVQLQDLREAAGASRDVVFSISFTFAGSEP